MRATDQKAVFALNDEQRALMEEWKNLKERMNKAQMIFLFDESYTSFGVINGEKVAEIEIYESFYEEEYHEYLDDNAVEWGNFELPNLTTFYGGEYSPFMLFDGGVEKRNLNLSMESAAL